MGEIVDGEAQFVSVAAFLTSCIVGSPADSGIVDEHVDPVVLVPNRSDHRPDIVERGKICPDEVCRPSTGVDPGYDLTTTLLVPTMYDDVHTGCAEAERDLTAEPIGRAGHERDSAVRGGCAGRTLRRRSGGRPDGSEKGRRHGDPGNP